MLPKDLQMLIRMFDQSCCSCKCRLCDVVFKDVIMVTIGTYGIYEKDIPEQKTKS